MGSFSRRPVVFLAADILGATSTAFFLFGTAPFCLNFLVGEEDSTEDEELLLSKLRALPSPTDSSRIALLLLL